jgi:Kef-type K+ transport system membrane component KefB
MKRAGATFLSFGLLVLVSASAGAQRRSSLVAGIGATRDSVQPATALASRARGTEGRAVRVANGALIGAGIGVAIGLIASPIVNAQNGDHTEDSMTYVMLPAFGAFLGLIFGGIAGLMRGS